MVLKDLKKLSKDVIIGKYKKDNVINKFEVKKSVVVNRLIDYVVSGDYLVQDRAKVLLKSYWDSDLNARFVGELLDRPVGSVRASISRLDRIIEGKVGSVVTILVDLIDGDYVKLEEAEKLLGVVTEDLKNYMLEGILTEFSEKLKGVSPAATLDVSENELDLFVLYSKERLNVLLNMVDLSMVRLILYIVNFDDPKFINERFILSRMLSGVISSKEAFKDLNKLYGKDI